MDEGDLVLEWSLHPRHSEVVPTLLVPAGLMLALYGFYLIKMAGPPLVMAVLIGALALFLLVRLVQRRNVVQALRIGDADLTVERRTGGRTADRRTVPLAAITAVDFSQDSGGLGDALQIRTGGAKKLELPASGEASPSLETAAALIEGAIRHRRTTVSVPLGRLPFGDRVRVHLPVSAEIAQRTGRRDADL